MTNKAPGAQRQQGVALMIVIFIFALVSILAVGMYNRQNLFVQMTSNQLALSQAYQYALATEIYGRRILKDNWDKSKDKMFFEQDYVSLKSSILTPLDEAFMEAQYNDLQGRLNLNDLVNLDGTPNLLMAERFKRLFNRLAIDSIKVEVIQDWIDENQQPNQIDGIEDGDYLVADPPYRNAGQPFTHVSELLLLPGITPEDYQKLLPPSPDRPHVSALPQGMVKVNVNTATKEVLQSLVVNLSDPQVDELASKQESEPWKDINSFKDDIVEMGLQVDTTQLDVYSEFFEIATRITLADRVVRLVSVIYRKREDGAMTLLQRDQGQKYLITKEKIAL